MEECQLPSEFGDFRLLSYIDAYDQRLHLAMVYGEPDMNEPVLVRVHMQNTLCDVLGGQLESCSHSLHTAMQRVAKEGDGVILVLRNADNNDAILQQIRNYQDKDKGVKSAESTHSDDLRTYGLGAQILRDLGVSKMNILGSRIKLHGLSGFDLEINDYVSFK